MKTQYWRMHNLYLNLILTREALLFLSCDYFFDHVEKIRLEPTISIFYTNYLFFFKKITSASFFKQR